MKLKRKAPGIRTRRFPFCVSVVNGLGILVFLFGFGHFGAVFPGLVEPDGNGLLGVVTGCPLLDLSLPSFISCMASSTYSWASLLYFAIRMKNWLPPRVRNGRAGGYRGRMTND
jgi:hypothetical protein